MRIEFALPYDSQINAKLRVADVRKILMKTSIVNDLLRMLRDQNDDVRKASAEAFIRLARHGTYLLYISEPVAHYTIADIRSRVLDGKSVNLLVNTMRKEEQFARISAAEVIGALAEIGK